MQSVGGRANAGRVARYGVAANMAIIGAMFDIRGRHDLEGYEKQMILDALNSAGLPSPKYTWEGVKKASTTFLFWLPALLSLLLLPPSALPPTATCFCSSIPFAVRTLRDQLPLRNPLQTTPLRALPISNMEHQAKAGRGDRWGPSGHFGLLMGLLAVIRRENISLKKHKELILAAFESEGLEDYTWEGVR